MQDDRMRYDRMVERALRGVVQDSLRHVVEHGLPGDHHFYITFRTGHPDVDLAGYLRERYPEEMTIVLQYQFYGLEVDDDGFSVTLSFNNRHERLAIPFAAVTMFHDPSVNFALQFQTPPDGRRLTAAEGRREAPPSSVNGDDTADDGAAGDEPPGGKVVTLDQFRKK